MICTWRRVIDVALASQPFSQPELTLNDRKSVQLTGQAPVWEAKTWLHG